MAQQCTVVVSSITHAMTGQKLLERNGIRAYIDRDMDAYGKYGCGYVLRIHGNCQTAVSLLQGSHVKIKEIIQ